jgi:hypothetical protein
MEVFSSNITSDNLMTVRTHLPQCPDAAGIAEAAILQHSSGRKYVVVFENVLDARCLEFERIATLIQKVMDADHP